MRVAFFSDIHANFPALVQAFESAKRHGVSKVFCAGDITGFGPHPTEVVRLLREHKVQAVRGNVDRKVLALAGSPKKLKSGMDSKKSAPAAWSALNLGEEELKWLSALPAELPLSFSGKKLMLVHGSPLSDTDYIFPSITGQALLAKLGGEKPDILVCGHTHIPFTHDVADVRVVNCGSVGRPVDGDPRGSYAILDIQQRGPVRTQVVRFAYSVDDLVSDLKARRVPSVKPREYRLGIKPKGS